ncbi:MAG: Hydrolase [uncultured bacterium]|nr:MAG: Hydrolase [uncultured bacterium]
MVKAIIFDLDGTLINEDQIDRGLVYVYKTNTNTFKGITQNKFIDANTKAFDSLLKMYKSRKILLSQFGILIWYKTVKILNLPETPIVVNKLYRSLQKFIISRTIPLDGAVEVLSFIKKSGYKVGILSNGLFEERINKIKKTKLSKFIDVLVTTDIVGFDKPNKKPFKFILDILNVKPDEAIFIGNSLTEDIYGAKNAKIKAFWYSKLKEGEVDCRIYDLVELIPIIRNMSNKLYGN